MKLYEAHSSTLFTYYLHSRIILNFHFETKHFHYLTYWMNQNLN